MTVAGTQARPGAESIQRSAGRRLLWLAVLALFLLVVVVASVIFGVRAVTLDDALAALTHEIRRFGLFNFVMSNGDNLFAHASTLLHYIVRKAPFGKARLLDDDVMVDFSEVTTPNDKVAVIATLPLTRDETWSQLAVDELVMFRQGDIARSDRPEQPVYMSVEEGLAIARAVGVSV